MKTYDDLFLFLEEQLGKTGCDHTLKQVKMFCEANDLSFEELSQTLNDLSGFCDCEVLMNSVERVKGDAVIGQDEVDTPRKFAIRNALYCHTLVNGEPVPSIFAIETRAADAEVQPYVPCSKHDAHAVPDLNRACALMAMRDAK